MVSELFDLPNITKADVEWVRRKAPRRICFAYTHRDQPKRSVHRTYVGSFSIPFQSTIKDIFESDTRITLDPSNDGDDVWHWICSEEEFEIIVAWKQRQGTRIFLRDCLALSIALDQNFVDNQGHQY